MGTMSGWILSAKVLLISAGVVALAMGLKFSVPVAVNGIPAMWSIILSWMKPPYLYIIINGIIITIAASSRFHQSQSEQPAARSEHLISVKTPPPSTFAPFSAQMDIMSVVQQSTAVAEAEVVVSEVEDTIVELKPVMVNGSKIDVDIKTEEETVVETQDVFVDSTTSTYNTLPQKIISQELQVDLLSVREKPLFPVREKPLLPVREKPPASSRFGHRRPIRNSPEVSGVRSLKVAKPKRQETLESTWKMITEGRHVPLTRHLKKSDTWEHHHPPAVDQVTKSETFKERSNYESPPAAAAAAASLKIRKEPSLSQEELNRRVEAFIHKFNEEMRMQRQESLNQYMEMINRGV